jgi:hypothetical protein
MRWEHCLWSQRDDIVAMVMPFVTGNIQAEDWRLREASTMSFGCILDGPSKESLAPLVNEAIPIMLQKLQVRARASALLFRVMYGPILTSFQFPWTIGLIQCCALIRTGS